ncbi:MAG: glycosyltransferase [Pseudomonadota bacterium]
MKVAMVIGSASRLGGGVSEALAGLVAALKDRGMAPIVITLRDAHTQEDKARFDGVRVIACDSVGPHRFRFPLGLAGALVEARPDVIHLHGLWMRQSKTVLAHHLKYGTPYIVSPHGMADPWIMARSRLLKKAVFALYEGELLTRARSVHALNAAEATAVMALRPRVETVVIPNGVATPFSVEEVRRRRMAAVGAPLRYLYLGRLHPKKNVDGLLAGWKRFLDNRGLYDGAAPRLDIVGWGDAAYEASLRAEIDRMGSAYNVTLLGPLFGADKHDAFCAADFTVLPTHSEGAPLTPLEGWAAGALAIASPACGLDFAYGDGLAVKTGVEPEEIAAALDRAYAVAPDTRAALSAAAMKVVQDRFSWSAIAAQWERVYAGSLQTAAEEQSVRRTA